MNSVFAGIQACEEKSGSTINPFPHGRSGRERSGLIGGIDPDPVLCLGIAVLVFPGHDNVLVDSIVCLAG